VPKLRDLDACFLRRNDDRSMQRLGDTAADPDGVIFLCPKCFEANGGPTGTHSVICWFVGKVPDDASPKPGRWNPGGPNPKSIDALTFVGPGATSVLLTAGCGWHGFVVNGEAN
jgi:hypothetical protein